MSCRCWDLHFSPPSKCWSTDWILSVQSIQTFFMDCPRQIACKKCRQVKGLVLITLRASVIMKPGQPLLLRCFSVTPAWRCYLKGELKEQSRKVLSLHLWAVSHYLEKECSGKSVLPFHNETLQISISSPCPSVWHMQFLILLSPRVQSGLLTWDQWGLIEFLHMP